jgi:hypothetical protein
MSDEERYRTESDSLGEMQVPADAYWGAQTQRALENFPISGITFGRRFVRALGVVKKAAAQANRDLDRIPDDKADAIVEAADEVIAGEHDDQFPVDVFQTGSGTSSAAATMASAVSWSTSPRSRFACAAAFFTTPSARTNRRPKPIPEMGKFSIARWVWAPQ